MLPGVRGYLFGAAAPPAEPLLLAVGHASGSAVSYSLGIGTAHADRRVIVSIAAVMGGGGTGGAISAVTIGGVSATLLKRHGVTTAYQYAGIWMASVPTGSTATVAITRVGFTRFSLQAYRVVGLISATPHDTDEELSGTNHLVADVPAGGFAICVAHNNGTDADPPPYTLTGGVTEDYAVKLSAALTSYNVHASLPLSVAGETLDVNDTAGDSDYSGSRAAMVTMA